MALPFLRPSPPPSMGYLRLFLGTTGRRCSTRLSRTAPKQSPSSSPARGYASAAPSSANPTGPPAGPDTKPTSAPAPTAHSSTTTTTTSPSTSSPLSSQSQSQSSSPPIVEALPYFVRRTASQALPVYHSVKAGGTLRQTLVRRVEGDRDALRARLIEELPTLIKAENVKINRLNGHIVIKGHIAREVAGVLRRLHF